VLEILTGVGVATSAGLNAYIPLLMIGVLARFTDLIDLPSGWQWLEHPWVMAILVILLVVEMIADKIPVVDHLNDVVQTVVRPTAGGLAFGAASSSTTPIVSDPSLLADHPWAAFVAGGVISLIVHTAKALSRPVVNLSTAGLGAPVASTAEDAFSVAMSFFAILFPLLVVAFVLALAWLFVTLRRRRRARRRERERAATHDGQTLEWRE
jgi:Flp pilus assembly protein TadB